MLQVKHYLVAVLSVLFPCALGAVAMAVQNVPVNLWALNILAVVLLACAVGCVSKLKPTGKYGLVLLGCVLLIMLPFLQKGIDGVHRWVYVGAFSLNAAMAVLPMAIISIHHVLQRGRNLVALPGVTLVAVALLFQPDASQLTGFTLAMMPCLVLCRLPRWTKVSTGGLLMLASILSWIFLDSLEPVDYTERILSMLGNLSAMLYIVGLLSVLLVPVPFVIFSADRYKMLSLSVALYYWGITVSALFGNFPVPVMGYGISPIIGYFAVTALQMKEFGLLKE